MKRFPILLFCLFLFQNLFAADYYWVGGNGNWTDYSHHWATTSGGNVYHPQIPGPLDNVIIDNKSLSGKTTITLDQTIETCNDMTISITTDTISFQETALNPKLSIYGSLTLNSRSKFSNTIQLFFEASTGTKYIAQRGASLPCYLIFNNSASWQVVDSLNVESIEIKKGNFDASNKKIKTLFFLKNVSPSFVNLSNTIISTNSFKLSNGSDITTGMKMNIIQSKYNSATATIELNSGALSIDSVFCKEPIYLTVRGNGHINYISLKNLVSASFNYDGRIERLDATISQFNYTGGFSNLFIKEFNVNNLSSFSLNGGQIEIEKLTYISNRDCNNLLNIIGFGNSKLLIHNNNDVIFDYCSVTNINTGAYPITVTNALDLGGNIGVNFASYLGAYTLYRIGAGAWSDVTKWSLTSNGPPANCKPTIYTSVVFDAYSFQQPSNRINFENGNCKNITISNLANPVVFYGKLNCTGNFHSYSSLEYDFAEIIFLSTSPTNTIYLTNSEINPSLYLRFYSSQAYHFLSDIDCSLLQNNNTSIYTDGFNLNISSIELESGFFDGSTSSINTVGFNKNMLATVNCKSTTITTSGFTNASVAPVQYKNLIMDGSAAFSSGIAQVNHLTIKKNILIYNGSLQCDTITFWKGNVLTTKAVIDVDVFNNPGSLACGSYTKILATEGQFNSARDIIFNNFILEGVKVPSNAIHYTAVNSIDGLNNTGVVFTQPASKTYYWIGGSGDWNNAANWSSSSGGSSAQCIPTRIDDVIFDANSFSTVSNTVSSIDLVECNNFIFKSNAQTFFQAALSVYGSFYSDSIAKFNGIVLKGNKASVFDADKSIFSGITVERNNSTVFTSGLTTETFEIKNGTVKLVNMTLQVHNFSASIKNTDSLISLNSTMKINYAFNIDVKNGKVDMKSNFIDYTIDRNYNVSSIISDSIPINIGSINIDYITPEFIVVSDDIQLNLTNCNVETMNISADVTPNVLIGLFNTQIHTTKTFNEKLFIGKSYWYSTRDFDRQMAQPADKNKIHDAHLASYEIAIDNIIFDHLKIYPGTTLAINASDTLYINKSLDITGAPSFPIQIRSSNNGMPAYIDNKGSVCGEYLFVNDSYVLNNSANAGFLSSDVTNNSGWNFNHSCDTILCSFNKNPCENDSIQFFVVSNQILINTMWKGPNGFLSTKLAPQKNHLTSSDNGLYTFTCIQGSCNLYVNVFNNAGPKLIDELITNRSVSVDDYTLTPSWYFKNELLENERNVYLYPSFTTSGYIKASVNSNRGCTSFSDSIFYAYALDPDFKPDLKNIELAEYGSIKLDWAEMNHISGYYIFEKNPFNTDYTSVNFVDPDITSYKTSSLLPGDYCYYIKVGFSNNFDLGPSSDTLCMNIPDNLIVVKPDLTHLDLIEQDKLQVQWNEVENAVNYSILGKYPTSNGNFEQLTIVSGNSYIHPNYGDGNYCFYIKANFASSNYLSLPSDTLCLTVKTEVSTGITNAAFKNTSIYPNPTNTGTVTIAPENNSVYSITIETLQGERVYYKENQYGTITVPISEYKQGIYLVRTQNDNFATCEKLIITK